MLVSRKALLVSVSTVIALVLIVCCLPMSEAQQASPTKNKSSRELSEVTTNPTNSTNKKLITEDTESTEENSSTFGLVYDGKSFEEWRDLWKTELKTEKRIECIKAFAAFGRAGKGKAAAEAILDVAEQYDFSTTFSPGMDYVEDDAVIELKKSIAEVLTQYGNHLPERAWLPLLKQRLDKEAAKYKWLGADLLLRLVTNDPKVKQILLDLLKNSDRTIRAAALAAIGQSHDIFKEDEKKQLVQKTLSKDVLMALEFPRGNLLNFIEADQWLSFLLSDQHEIQLAARKATPSIYEQEKVPRLANALLAILKDQDREQDHLAALRALAALGNRAVGAEPHLNSIIESSTDEEMLLAAINARESVTQKRGGYGQMALSDESKAILERSTRGPKLIEDPETLRQKLAAEHKNVAGNENIYGGFGGIGGGGGAF